MINKIKNIIEKLCDNIETYNVSVWKGKCYDFTEPCEYEGKEKYLSYDIDFTKANKIYSINIHFIKTPQIVLEEKYFDKKVHLGTIIKIPFIREDHPDLEESCYKLYMSCKKFIENDFSKFSEEL